MLHKQYWKSSESRYNYRKGVFAITNGEYDE